jgi:hypothetical protein
MKRTPVLSVNAAYNDELLVAASGNILGGGVFLRSFTARPYLRARRCAGCQHGAVRSPFSITRQCNLCGRVVVFERLPNLDALTGTYDPEPRVVPDPQRYCPTCGGELHEVSKGDGEALDAEARELARSGHEIAVYGPVAGECWALVGPSDDRIATLFAAVAPTAIDAAREARAFLNRVVAVDAPAVDVSELTALGLSAQWGVLQHEPGRVALRAWRGETLAVSSIATGAPQHCIASLLRHLSRVD